MLLPKFLIFSFYIPLGLTNLLLLSDDYKEDALLQQLSNVIEFRIKDDMGNEIVHNTGSSFGSSEEGTIYIEGNDIFNPISEDVKELTISPYFNLPKEGKITEIDEEGNEMILDLKQFENSELSFDSFTVSLVEK